MIFLLALALGGVGLAEARLGPVAPIYLVERIRDLIAPDAKVGTKRAGLICLPNGAIRWQDVAVGGVVDRRETVEDVLEDADLAIAHGAGDGPGRRTIGIRGVVTAASFDLCAKKWGLGDHGALSGSATMVVEWRLLGSERNGEDARHVSTVERRVEGKSAASLGAISRMIFQDTARDLAKWLASRPPE